MKAPLQAPKSFGSAASSAPAQRKAGLKTIVDNRPTMVAQRKLQGVVSGDRISNEHHLIQHARNFKNPRAITERSQVIQAKPKWMKRGQGLWQHTETGMFHSDVNNFIDKDGRCMDDADFMKENPSFDGNALRTSLNVACVDEGLIDSLAKAILHELQAGKSAVNHAHVVRDEDHANARRQAGNEHNHSMIMSSALDNVSYQVAHYVLSGSNRKSKVLRVINNNETYSLGDKWTIDMKERIPGFSSQQHGEVSPMNYSSIYIDSFSLSKSQGSLKVVMHWYPKNTTN